MAQANDINKRSDWRKNTDRKVLADDELLPSDIECVTREDVNCDSLAQSWNAAAAGNRYVDLGRNGVCKTMASQSRNETKCPAGRAMCDLEQILIDLVCISPA